MIPNRWYGVIKDGILGRIREVVRRKRGRERRERSRGGIKGDELGGGRNREEGEGGRRIGGNTIDKRLKCFRELLTTEIIIGDI